MARVSNKDEARKAFKNWGFSDESITMEDIEHLKNGGWLVFNNGEYSTGVYLEGLEEHCWNRGQKLDGED